jgi:regulator of sigma E protease
MMIGAFLLVLGPLVVLHELGHYLVGRAFKVKADVFSIGFGKELAGWTDKRGTRWRIAALPLGGYVQFAGDMNATSVPNPDAVSASPEKKRGMFQYATLWQRALIVLAGPLMNLLVAIAIFAAFNVAYGVPVAAPVIGDFSKGSVAAAAGFKPGDRIVAIDGAQVDSFMDIAERVALYPGRTVSIAAERNGVSFNQPVRLATDVQQDRFGNEIRRGLLGIRPAAMEFQQVGPIRAVVTGAKQSLGIVRTMAAGLVQIVTGERPLDELGGPIKIAKFSGEQLSLGWLSFVSFAALISINLAFINLLPIPTLDGGHLAMYAAEAVRRKPLGARSQEWAFRTGLAFMLALMLFVTLNDITSLSIFGGQG